jgi:serine/threonine protein phosphatase PrpC
MKAPSLEFTYALDRDQGARAYQEDSVEVWRANGSERSLRSPLLAVLADGMGGHVAGERASQIAVSRYLETFSAAQGAVAQSLAQSLKASNEAIGSEIRQSPMLAGMGCTLVAAYLNEEGLRWVSVGDSALLLFRGSTLIRLNEDHSLGALLDKQALAHQIPYEEAKSDPRRRALRSALVGADIPVKDLCLEPYPLYHGDWVIVASDGLETLKGDEIATILGRRKELGDPAAAVKDLLNAVRRKAAPNQDNVSIIVIKIVDLADASTEIVAAPTQQVEAVEKLETPELASANGVGEATGTRKGAGILPIALSVLALSIAGLFLARHYLSGHPTSTHEGSKAASEKTEQNPPAPAEAPRQVPDPSAAPASTQPQALDKPEGSGKEEKGAGSSEGEPPAKAKEPQKDKKAAAPNNHSSLAGGQSKAPPAKRSEGPVPAQSWWLGQ